MGGVPSEQASPSPGRNGYLKFSLDLPSVKFELESDTPEQSLAEVRRIIEALNVEQAEPLDAGAYDLTGLSDEFSRHPVLEGRLKNAVVLGEQVAMVKRVIPVEQEYDLETGQTRQIIHIRESVGTLFNQAAVLIRDCLIHIRGDLTREQERVIMDAIRQRLGVDVRPRFFSTRKNLEGKVLVEAVCFGERPQE